MTLLLAMYNSLNFDITATADKSRISGHKYGSSRPSILESDLQSTRTRGTCMHIFETLMGVHVHGSMLPFFERKMLAF